MPAPCDPHVYLASQTQGRDRHFGRVKSADMTNVTPLRLKGRKRPVSIGMRAEHNHQECVDPETGV
jgi:hypothetical protein